MVVQIHLVRHAQGFHNLCVENEALRDPLLTDLGKQQCADLRAAFPHHDRLTHLVASPLRRTLETCLLGFSTDEAPKNKVISLPELQEVSDAPCDTGSAIAEVEPEFRERGVDFSRVPEDWTEKQSEKSPWEPTLAKLEVRAREARRKLREIAAGGGDVVAVTHGGFLHFLTTDFHGIDDGKATGWKNTEFRSYTFADETGEDPEALLVETEESWRRRQGEKNRPSADEQAERKRVFYRDMEPFLKYTAERGWMQ
ncbi:phosphoglycerate mutase family protein [Colletotrichum sojae]|uniref:Phosphoglycerate mutase family protein n=1 Tax=Colletotrichum sojae TaxID=2175907 RepID=A0A8H6JUY9_9PEZI|nr:phosphoglycerate mutase family protein [Colletotrichum sojae]